MTESEPTPTPLVDPVDSEDIALDRRILRASLWVAVSFGGRQVISFVSTLVLLRLLAPQDFGLAALALTLLNFVQVVQESGVGAALVHRRTDLQHAAMSSFVFAAGASVVLYAAAFGVAPFAATVFHKNFDAGRLTDVVRVLAVLMLFRGISVVPSALLERSLDFRTRTVSDMSSALVQAVVSIGLALAGAGVWALVLGQVVAAAVATAVLWLLVEWRPRRLDFHGGVLRELLGYGRFVSAGNILTVIALSVDNFVVARLLGAKDLGFYAVSWRLCELPVIVIGTIVGRVMFPVYAGLQHDLRGMRRGYVQNLQRMALLSLPVTIGLAVAARPFVLAVLGNRWEPSIDAMRLLAIFAVIRSLLGPTSELFKGAGKPQLNLVAGALYPAIALPLLYVLTRHWGLVGAAAAVAIATGSIGVVTMTLLSRLLQLRLTALFRALAPSSLCTALMAVAMLATVKAMASSSPPATLAAAVAVGTVVYVAATAVFARGIVLTMWRAFRAPAEPPATERA